MSNVILIVMVATVLSSIGTRCSITKGRVGVGDRMTGIEESKKARGLLGVGFFFFSSRRRHTRLQGDWSSDVCSSDLQPGEVARLRAIVEPNITVVTSIAEEHLEGLGDLAGVMREELAACDGVATAVVPASQQDVVAEARRRARVVISAGLDEGDVRATGWELA